MNVLLKENVDVISIDLFIGLHVQFTTVSSLPFSYNEEELVCCSILKFLQFYFLISFGIFE